MRPSERVAAAAWKAQDYWRDHGAQAVPQTALDTVRIEEIVKILDEFYSELRILGEQVEK